MAGKVSNDKALRSAALFFIGMVVTERSGSMGSRGKDFAEQILRIGRILERTLAMAERAVRAEAAESGVAAVRAHADLLAQIVRTAEKVHELKRVMAIEADAAGTGPLTGAERAALRERVEGWIEERVEQRLREKLAAGPAERAVAADGDPPPDGNEGGA